MNKNFLGDFDSDVDMFDIQKSNISNEKQSLLEDVCRKLGEDKILDCLSDIYEWKESSDKEYLLRASDFLSLFDSVYRKQTVAYRGLTQIEGLGLYESDLCSWSRSLDVARRFVDIPSNVTTVLYDLCDEYEYYDNSPLWRAETVLKNKNDFTENGYEFELEDFVLSCNVLGNVYMKNDVCFLLDEFLIDISLFLGTTISLSPSDLSLLRELYTFLDENEVISDFDPKNVVLMEGKVLDITEELLDITGNINESMIV